MMLGDLGAEVIKVEAIKGGDPTRSWGPPFAPNKEEEGARGESAYFLAVNRNKKSLAVDLKSPEGVEIVRSLARVSDVVVENFIPGKLDQLGLGFDDLAKDNSRGGLIYASITGFGADGPLASRGGYDIIAAGMGGLMGMTGSPDGPPVKVGVAITDVCTGMLAQGAITSALLARERGVTGSQKLDLSLFETQLATLVNIGSNYLVGGKPASRWGTAHESIVPYQAFPTADEDGYIIVAATTDPQYSRLSAALGKHVPELIEHQARFATNADRVANREELVELISQYTRTKSTAECEALFVSLDLATGPINSMEDVFANPQVSARDMVVSVDHPTAGPVDVVGIPVKYSETPGSVRSAPPLLGQHTTEILSSVLSYSPSDISHLQSSGVCL